MTKGEKKRRYRRKLRDRMLAHFGRKCGKCGFSDARALELDHIAGGGKTERKKYNYGREVWLLEALRIEGKYQLLCANCNRIKQWENHEWDRPPIEGGPF